MQQIQFGGRVPAIAEAYSTSETTQLHLGRKWVEMGEERKGRCDEY